MADKDENRKKELVDKVKKTVKSSDFPANVGPPSYLQVPPDLLLLLSAGNADADNRLSAIQALAASAVGKTVKEEQVSEIWKCFSDLTHGTSTCRLLKAALSAMTVVVQAASTCLSLSGAMRNVFLVYVEGHKDVMPTELLFNLLLASVNGGTEVSMVEDGLPAFFTLWYPQLLDSNQCRPAMLFFIELITLHGSFFEEQHVKCLVQHTVVHMYTTTKAAEGMLGLRVLDTLVKHLYIPTDVLAHVLVILCRISVSDTHRASAWRVMRSLLDSPKWGLAAFYELGTIIKHPTHFQDSSVICGAVFYLRSALWTTESVEKFKVELAEKDPLSYIELQIDIPLSLLQHASTHTDKSVVHQVALAVQAFINHHKPDDIRVFDWVRILGVISRVYTYTVLLPSQIHGQVLMDVINATIDNIEALREDDHVTVTDETFYPFMQPMSLLRPITSAIDVLDSLMKLLLEVEPSVDQLGVLLEQNYSSDRRPELKLAALGHMDRCRTVLTRASYTALLDKVILPCLADYRAESMEVRVRVVALLGAVVYEHNNPIIDRVLALLKKTITEPFNATPAEFRLIELGGQSDVDLALEWLVKIFKRRMWHLPSCTAITAFESLLVFVDTHYDHPLAYRVGTPAKRQVFEMLFAIRASSTYEIGLPDMADAQPTYGLPVDPNMDLSTLPRYTPYIVLDHKSGRRGGQESAEKHVHQRPLLQRAPEGSPRKVLRLENPLHPEELRKLSSGSQEGEPSQTLAKVVEFDAEEPVNRDGVRKGSTGSEKLKRADGSPHRTPTKSVSGASMKLPVLAESEAPEVSVKEDGKATNESNESVDLQESSGRVEDAAVVSGEPGSDLEASLTSSTAANQRTADLSGASTERISDYLARMNMSGDASEPASFIRSPDTMSNGSYSASNKLNCEFSRSTEELRALASSIDALELSTSSAQQKAETSKAQNLHPEDLSVSPKCSGLPDLPASSDPWRNAQRENCVTHLSLTGAARSVVRALPLEKNWELLLLILQGIPKMLQNKSLIISRESNYIDYFARALCVAATERPISIQGLIGAPPDLRRHTFDNYIYLAISCLASYRGQLTVAWQKQVMECLASGTKTRCSDVCFAALTLCTLEMPSTMVNQIRQLLINLSQCSSTVVNSQPVLEFINTLLHNPRIYNSFNSIQYQTIFAIVIPYTNPVRYNQYVVFLAFHVLAMWFVKCRVLHRKTFITFIIKNLRNVIGADDLQQTTLRRVSTSEPSEEAVEKTNLIKANVKAHGTMTVLLSDLMSRYTYGFSNPLPVRSEWAEAMVGDSAQQTWVVGNKIYTITTSGCSQRTMTEDGLCENCHATCRVMMDKQKECEEKLKEQKEKKKEEENEHPREQNIALQDDECPMNEDDSNGDGFHVAEGNTAASFEELRHVEMSDSNTTLNKDSKESYLCTCWCVGFAEVYIRQPTGNQCFMIRLDNFQPIMDLETPTALDDLSTLYGPKSAPKRLDCWDDKDPDSNEEEVDNYQRQSKSSLNPQTNLLSTEDLDDQEDEDANFSRQSLQRTLSNPEVGSDTEGSSPLHRKTSGTSGTSPSPSKPSKINEKLSRLGKFLGTGSKPPSVSKDREMFGQRQRVRHNSAANETTSSVDAGSPPRVEDTDPEYMPPQRRGRSQTLSAMSARPPRPALPTPSLSQIRLQELSEKDGRPEPGTTTRDPNASEAHLRGGMEPANVLMQLFMSVRSEEDFSDFDRPLFLPARNEDFMNSIQVMDLSLPVERYKIGVLYVGPGQVTERQVFGNTGGSTRYHRFVQGLGAMVDLRRKTKTSLLVADAKEEGPYTVVWRDNIMQVEYHVATMMPNIEGDVNYANKKRHIGNDHVTIVYNDSGKPYDQATVRSQFNTVIVEIRPTDHAANTVHMLRKQEVQDLLRTSPVVRLVTDANLASYSRQIALHSTIACLVLGKLKVKKPYSNSWSRRLDIMTNLRNKLLKARQELQASGAPDQLDFTAQLQLGE